MEKNLYLQTRISLLIDEAKANNELSWFTKLVYWYGIKRYVVGVTNNNDGFTIEKLTSQAQSVKEYYDNVTVWWRTSEDGELFIDIWFSTNELVYALQTARRLDQQAIWDTRTQEEIKVPSNEILEALLEGYKAGFWAYPIDEKLIKMIGEYFKG